MSLLSEHTAQPRGLARTLATIAARIAEIAGGLAARGASDNAACCAKYLCEGHAHRPMTDSG